MNNHETTKVSSEIPKHNRLKGREGVEAQDHAGAAKEDAGREKKPDGRKNKIITNKQTVARILKKCELNPATGCLEWRGYTMKNGYGQTTFRKKLSYVHRVIYMATYGVNLNSREFVCHKCDNPCCCNVEHHFIGDYKANAQDMVQKGRDAITKGTAWFPVGEKCHLSKISDDDERRIKEMLKQGIGPSKIWRSLKLPITIAAISKIKHGHSRNRKYEQTKSTPA